MAAEFWVSVRVPDAVTFEKGECALRDLSFFEHVRDCALVLVKVWSVADDELVP